MTIQGLVEIAKRGCNYRTYCLENESEDDYRRVLGTAVPAGPFVVDFIPDLRALSEFVTALTSARLTNLESGDLEVQYRKG